MSLKGSNELKLKIGLALVLIAMAVLSRLLPHPYNFTPVAAIALFAGALLPVRMALTLPLAAMVISDLIIGLHALVFLTWGCFIATVLLGKYLISRINPAFIISVSIFSSVLFYLVTNFGVWMEGRMYPMTMAGLIDCYYMGLPFFRNTLVGDLFYSGLLFGAYSLIHNLVTSKRLVLS